MSISGNEGRKINLKVSPLYEAHNRAGARFVEFAGWKMPVLYSSIIKEHLTVRDSVGIFDISHMGEIEVTGEQAGNLLQRIISNDLSNMKDGQALYTVICNEEGGIIDDLLVYRITGEGYLLCVNAVNTDTVFGWLRRHNRREAEIVDRTSDFALLALQGPDSEAVLQVLTGYDLRELKRFHFIREKMLETEVFISRTGYTGEDGFEIFIPSEKGSFFWSELLKIGKEYGIKPAGLGARDTLRLEMAYPLYGHEIDSTTDPYQAGLGWVVKTGKGDFVGRKALLAAKDRGLTKKMVGLEMVDKGISRQGNRIFRDEQEVGYITSGTMSPSLRVPIAMGYAPVSLADEGTMLDVEIRGRLRRARVVKRPFYRPPGLTAKA